MYYVLHLPLKLIGFLKPFVIDSKKQQVPLRLLLRILNSHILVGVTEGNADPTIDYTKTRLGFTAVLLCHTTSLCHVSKWKRRSLLNLAQVKKCQKIRCHYSYALP